ncbi:MAG: class I adenylate-forming enzyme family protein [Patescibacteria group bacterium]
MSAENRNVQPSVDALVEAFRAHADASCLIDAHDGRSWTYREYLDEAVSCAARLRAHGLAGGETVVLIMGNSVRLLVLYLASLLGGYTVVPIDPLKGKDEVEGILSQIDVKLLITDVPERAGAARTTIDPADLVPLGPTSGGGPSASVDALLTVDAASTFLIAFTSGSTGVPKGVRHSFGNLALSARRFAERFSFDEGNVFYHDLPMTYMAGILNLWLMPLLSGSSIVVGDRFSISSALSFWDDPIRHRVNTFWFIPAILSILLKVDRGTLGADYARQARVMGCVGTAPLDPRTKKMFMERYGIELYESYGLSETLFVSTERPGDRCAEGGVGSPLDGVEVTFGPDDEIRIRAEWMFQGYRHETDGDRDRGQTFDSGDIGTVDAHGHLAITGRKKDIIIRGGINISPRSIESVLADSDEIESAVVLGIPDGSLGEKTVCMYVPREGRFTERSLGTIGARVVERLGPACRIDEFFRLDDVPRNINGKIDMRALRALYGNASGKT